jgi:hypothetical protein
MDKIICIYCGKRADIVKRKAICHHCNRETELTEYKKMVDDWLENIHRE